MAHPETAAAMTGQHCLACPDVRHHHQDPRQLRLSLRTITSTSS